MEDVSKVVQHHGIYLFKLISFFSKEEHDNNLFWTIGLT